MPYFENVKFSNLFVRYIFWDLISHVNFKNIRLLKCNRNEYLYFIAILRLIDILFSQNLTHRFYYHFPIFRNLFQDITMKISLASHKMCWSVHLNGRFTQFNCPASLSRWSNAAPMICSSRLVLYSRRRQISTEYFYYEHIIPWNPLRILRIWIALSCNLAIE